MLYLCKFGSGIAVLKGCSERQENSNGGSVADGIDVINVVVFAKKIKLASEDAKQRGDCGQMAGMRTDQRLALRRINVMAIPQHQKSA